MSPRLKETIEEKILNGERIKELFDLDSPIDCYIIERLAHYRFMIPLMKKLGNSFLSEDNYNNCIIDMYNELKNAGRIYRPSQKSLR